MDHDGSDVVRVGFERGDALGSVARDTLSAWCANCEVGDITY